MYSAAPVSSLFAIASLAGDGPGFLATLLMGLVAAGIILAAVGGFVLLVAMAAQAIVLGRPTLPPKG